MDLLDHVLYRDSVMIVLNKPAGIPVHAGPSKKENLEQYFDSIQFNLRAPPSLAHRLDRDTSGCLVLGRHTKGLRRLGKLFAAGAVKKTYWAVVEGSPSQLEGRIDTPLKRVDAPDRPGWLTVVHPQGQEAITDYHVLGQTNGMSWLELSPRTGRTHQIRVHCVSIGCPIVGEPHYGQGQTKGQGMLHLHARAVTVPLYSDRPPIMVEAPPPSHMLDALKACGWSPALSHLNLSRVKGIADSLADENQQS